MYYSWEMPLNIGLDASFGNMKEWKEIREKAGDVNNRKVSVENDEIFHRTQGKPFPHFLAREVALNMELRCSLIIETGGGFTITEADVTTNHENSVSIWRVRCIREVEQR